MILYESDINNFILSLNNYYKGADSSYETQYQNLLKLRQCTNITFVKSAVKWMSPLIISSSSSSISNLYSKIKKTNNKFDVQKL